MSAVLDGNTISLGPPLIFAVGTHFWYLSLLCLYHLGHIGMSRVSHRPLKLTGCLLHTFWVLPAFQPYPQVTVTTNHIIWPFTTHCLHTMLPSAPIADSKSCETGDWKAIQCLLPARLDLPLPQRQRELTGVVAPASLLLPTLWSHGCRSGEPSLGRSAIVSWDTTRCC